jgi:hypothetical protein
MKGIGLKGMDVKASLIAILILVVVAIVGVLLWSHPEVLVYAALALIGLLSYGALYIIVSAARRKHVD